MRPDMLDTPEKLLGNPELWGGRDLWSALYEPPKGDITAEHIQHAFYMAANYGFQLLNGKSSDRFNKELFNELWDLHMEWTNAFYEDLDRIAAEGIAGRCDTKIKGGVAQGIRGRPFRHMKPRDVAETMAPLASKPAEVAEREAVANAQRFDRAPPPSCLEGKAHVASLRASRRQSGHGALASTARGAGTGPMALSSPTC